MYQIIKKEPLSNHCTFRVGGKADYFAVAKSTEEITELIDYAKAEKLPYFIFAGGSNILFHDKGFRGLVIKIETKNLHIDKDLITADAGVKIPQLIKESVENGLSGLEKWLGLPGTVGGAVRGNAGCNGLETRDILLKATLLDPQTGKIKEVKPSYFRFSYRSSKIKHTDEIVLNATFKLKKIKVSPQKQKEIMDEIRKGRLSKQPFGLSSGSFFKNPSTKNPAGLLIDKAGIKGKKTGGAQISEKHGNFFLNLGKATSEDLKKLAKLAKREVKKQFNIELQEEVQIMSEYGRTKL